MSNIGKQIIYSSSTIRFFKSKNQLVLLPFAQFVSIKYNINLPLKLRLLPGNSKDFLALSLLPLLSKKNDFRLQALQRSQWGSLRAHIANTLFGLYKQHKLSLKFVGVGYKAALYKNVLVLRLGFCHKLFIHQNLVTLTRTKKRPPTFLFKGPDLNIIRSTAFLLRSFKKPEPYKGKGVVLLNEHLKLKEGKKNKN